MSYYLTYTGGEFIYAGKRYPRVPLLLSDKHTFIEPVCAYFRHLAIHEHLKPTSLKTYAEYILHFWKYLGKKDFSSINNSDLIGWFNSQEIQNVGKLTQGARCDVVFDLYIWLELNSFVNQMIRVPGHNDGDKFIPRLSVKSVRCNPQARRVSKYGIVSAVRPKGTSKKMQPTPTATDITNLYVVANGADSAEADRNSLLIDWYVQAGLRRLEWAALAVTDIPSWARIDEMTFRNEAFELELRVTKNSTVRHVSILPELLAKTREYIEGPRAAKVERFFRKDGVAYSQPHEIFLSNKTGQAMDLKAVSNLLTKWFKEAGVDGHGHRLRAAFLTNLFEAEISAEEGRIALNPGTKLAIDYELILMRVAERAGHRNIDSLRPYLSLIRKRRGRISKTTDSVTLHQQVIARQIELAVLEKKIAAREHELTALRSTDAPTT